MQSLFPFVVSLLNTKLRPKISLLADRKASSANFSDQPPKIKGISQQPLQPASRASPKPCFIIGNLPAPAPWVSSATGVAKARSWQKVLEKHLSKVRLPHVAGRLSM